MKSYLYNRRIAVTIELEFFIMESVEDILTRQVFSYIKYGHIYEHIRIAGNINSFQNDEI